MTRRVSARTPFISLFKKIAFIVCIVFLAGGIIFNVLKIEQPWFISFYTIAGIAAIVWLVLTIWKIRKNRKANRIYRQNFK